MRETAARLEERAKEAEREVQRIKRDVEKVETRHFHELRQLRQEQQQQEQENSRLRHQLASQPLYGGGFHYGNEEVVNDKNQIATIRRCASIIGTCRQWRRCQFVRCRDEFPFQPT